MVRLSASICSLSLLSAGCSQELSSRDLFPRTELAGLSLLLCPSRGSRDSMGPLDRRLYLCGVCNLSDGGDDCPCSPLSGDGGEETVGSPVAIEGPCCGSANPVPVAGSAENVLGLTWIFSASSGSD